MPADMHDALYLSLEQSPGDKLTLLALADWYEENDLPDAAAAVRWTIRRGYFPFRYTRAAEVNAQLVDVRDGWHWWGHDGQDGAEWGHPRTCRLPADVWKQLRGGFAVKPLVFKEYPTQAAAYMALLDAWPRMGHLALAIERERHR